MIRCFPILKSYLVWLRFGLAKIIFLLAEIPQIYLAEILLVLPIRRCRCWGWLVYFFFIKQTIEISLVKDSHPYSTFSPPLLNNSCLQVHFCSTQTFRGGLRIRRLSSPFTFLATWPLFNLAIELLWCEGGDDSWLILQESTFLRAV